MMVDDDSGPRTETPVPSVATRLRACAIAAAITGVAAIATVADARSVNERERVDAVPSAPRTVDVERARAKAFVARMTLAERAGQLVMTSVPGTVPTVATRRALGASRIGGVIVFSSNYRSRRQLASFVAGLDSAASSSNSAGARLLVSVDQEGGIVKRLPDAPPARSHPAHGRSSTANAAFMDAAASGAALRSAGISMNLAPVADLDLGPRHVMRERSFGAGPRRVGLLVSAFVRGTQARGVAAAVKHFPGFGGASVNSDDALARITRTRAQLDAADLVPFRYAVAARVDAVMMSHGVYTGIDGFRPASTSPATYRLLRDELGFDGVVVTDSLHAAGFAAAARTTPTDGCATSIAAGADIALVTGTIGDGARCQRVLVTAVRSGALPLARVTEAAERVLALKIRRGLVP